MKGHSALTRPFLVLGSVYAALAVGMGAFGAHFLKDHLTVRALAIFQTGVDYQFIHAIGLLVIGLIPEGAERPRILWTGRLFSAGVILFSGSLYVLALTGKGLFGMITPLGGTAFIAGWSLLGFHFYCRETEESK